MPAELIKPTGEVTPNIQPKNGEKFTIPELKKLIDCEWIIMYSLHDHRLMVADEDNGINLELEINSRATDFLNKNRSSEFKENVRGNVIICNREML